MAEEKKLSLKLKPKAPASAPTAAPAAGAAPAAAPAASAGGITLELRGASVHIAEVIIRKK